MDTDGDGTDDVAYQYDADGIRVASTTDAGETRFLIDANQPYAQVVMEYLPNGLIQVSYVHGLDLISQNRPATTGEAFYHVDGLGSTRALTNASGLVTDTYIYDAFGRTIGQIGSTGNVYLFAGEQRDLATGLDYLRARWMNPSVGGFYGMDPFQGFQQQPMSLHRFLYANANPVNNTDPSGEFTLAELVVTTAIQEFLKSPEIVFGSVKIVTTKILASALDPAFRAKEQALRQIVDGVNADLAIENYLAAQEVIALGFKVYHAGLGAIDDADAFSGLALSLGGVAEAFLNRSPQITANVQPLVDAIRDVRSTLRGPRLPGITPGYLEAVFGSIDLARTASEQLRLSLRSQGTLELVQSIIDAAQNLDEYLGVTQAVVSKLMDR